MENGQHLYQEEERVRVKSLQHLAWQLDNIQSVTSQAENTIQIFNASNK
jgi:hypothetical protein